MAHRMRLALILCLTAVLASTALGQANLAIRVTDQQKVAEVRDPAVGQWVRHPGPGEQLRFMNSSPVVAAFASQYRALVYNVATVSRERRAGWVVQRFPTTLGLLVSDQLALFVGDSQFMVYNAKRLGTPRGPYIQWPVGGGKIRKMGLSPLLAAVVAGNQVNVYDSTVDRLLYTTADIGAINALMVGGNTVTGTGTTGRAIYVAGTRKFDYKRP